VFQTVPKLRNYFLSVAALSLIFALLLSCIGGGAPLSLLPCRLSLNPFIAPPRLPPIPFSRFVPNTITMMASTTSSCQIPIPPNPITFSYLRYLYSSSSFLIRSLAKLALLFDSVIAARMVKNDVTIIHAIAAVRAIQKDKRPFQARGPL
jgi:hypothetical protein